MSTAVIAYVYATRGSNLITPESHDQMNGLVEPNLPGVGDRVLLGSGMEVSERAKP